MKKSKKIRIGVITGVIVAAIAGTLIGVFVPPLLNKTKIDELVKNQVKPAEGKGNFDTYKLNSEITAQPYNKKLESLELFTKEALKDENIGQQVLDSFVDNYIIEFWKGYKDSEAFTERYDEWIKNINKDWDEKVKDYKSRHGSNWGFYFQLEVLDPVGGNPEDWKRNQLRAKINADFDSYIFDQSYIRAKNKDGNLITSFTNFEGKVDAAMEEYLLSPEFVNGDGGAGKRNKIVFQATEQEIKNDPAKQAKANFQEFVFHEWVKSDMPLITSMTLWKHSDPTGVVGDNYRFFNQTLAERIYSGSTNVKSISPREGEESDSGSQSTQVQVSTDYKWQAFPSKTNWIDVGPAAQINTTDKYLNFIKGVKGKDGSGTLSTAFQIRDTAGINIDKKYTDDSSTMYYIELGNQSTSVFNTSYTQYAAAATYKFNQILGITDANVPSLNGTLKEEPFLGANTPSGTEIMANFLSKQENQTGYFTLPKQVQAILNDVPAGDLSFKGLYNGAKSIADTIDVPNSPFILTRNESGVHIIGIDRFSKLKEGFTSGQSEGLINELENTLLWRHILTESGLNGEGKLNNGFDFKLDDKFKSFYNANRTDLIYKYIKANETKTDDPSYVFSSKYTSIDSARKVADSLLKGYVDAFIDLKQYKKNVGNDANVKQKIIDLQVTKFSLTNKNIGNQVVSNGLGGQLPYTRNTTANEKPSEANKGYVNEVYGTYDSLKAYENFDKNKAFNEVELSKKLEAFRTAADASYDALNTKFSLGMKPLKYETKEYNQYLLLGCENDTSNEFYASDVQLVSEALNAFISNNGSKVKDILDIQRLYADVNAKTEEKKTRDDSKEDKTPNRVPADNKFADIANYALEGTYTDLNTMANAPAMPTTNDATATKYISYQLQKSFNESLRQDVVNNGIHYQGENGFSIDTMDQLARSNFLTNKLKNRYDTSVLDLIKDFIGLKSAFDYNEETGIFEFTKFRNYLIQQTSNNKKAAFVWVAKENAQVIKNGNTYWEDMSPNDHFKFRPMSFDSTSSVDINGYIYQGAAKADTYKNADGSYKDIGTYARTQEYNKIAPVEYNGTTGYTGFQGIVLQSSAPTDIVTEAQKALFGSEVYSYANSEGTVITDADRNDPAKFTKQGSLYNIGSRQNLINLINQNVSTWDTVRDTARWLHQTFDVNIDSINEANSVSEAKNKIVKIINDNKFKEGSTSEPGKIPESLFNRNVNRILSVAPSIFDSHSGQFFGDTGQPWAQLNQIVFTQFNYNDVVELFNTDTSNDREIDDPANPGSKIKVPYIGEEDKGINWAVLNEKVKSFGIDGTQSDTTKSKGFLGVSAEAFFQVAMNWYFTQSSYKSSAVKTATTNIGKILVYDRRLNDLFGKDQVENYKKAGSN